MDLRAEGVGFERVRDMSGGRGELRSLGGYDVLGDCCSIARVYCMCCHWTGSCKAIMCVESQAVELESPHGDAADEAVTSRLISPKRMA